MSPLTLEGARAEFVRVNVPTADLPNGKGPGFEFICPACTERHRVGQGTVTVGEHGEAQHKCANGCAREQIGYALHSLWIHSQLAAPARPHTSSSPDRSVDGGTFVLDAPTHTPAVWGEGDDVLWAEKEPLMIYAPQGTGKSTLAQQLILARVGIGDGRVLDLPVQPDRQRVLLIAGDRPNQIRRSFRRMVTEADRPRLAERLVVWPGPLPFDVVADPPALARFAVGYGAGTVVIGSLKDIALGLSEDVTGAAANLALQHLIAHGIEVLDLHHVRKTTAQKPGKPTSIDEVYGSTWLTTGHGSVVLLWGKPGDLVVELSHMKHPAGEVSRFDVLHDHRTGRSRRFESVSLLELVRAEPDGMTVRDAASILFTASDPNRNQIEEARRKLDALVNQRFLRGTEPGGPKQPARYVNTPRDLRDLSVTCSVTSIPDHDPDHGRSRFGSTAGHDEVMGVTEQLIGTAPSPLGERDVSVTSATEEEEARIARVLRDHPDLAGDE
jgi:replicative DNA helicase